jgi:DNA-binding winged helix-turn-helix (wHTH) protein
VDSLIAAAARALALGDPIGALNRIALRDDPPALALRGTAMAQLGDTVRAKALLRQAARAYGAREPVSRARCAVAEAEIALASRDLNWSAKSLSTARIILEKHGDGINAAHAHYLQVRRLLLIGQIDAAEKSLKNRDPTTLPPPLRAVHELITAGIAVRRVQAAAARLALSRASRAASAAGIPALLHEVEAAAAVLNAPAARLLEKGGERELRLEDVAALLSSNTLVVDACVFAVRHGATKIELARRPVLFMLARILAQAWPEDVSREQLVERAFHARRLDETYRARLRVEMGRLRKVLREVADVVATKRGFSIRPRRAPKIAVLARPVEDEHAAVLALLSDGESWSSSGLALALGVSARTVQRALGWLAEAGKVEALGQGRSRRWLSPPPLGFTTTLLLPAPLPSG